MNVYTLMGLAVICFIQNMAFTWTSRSRNSGDPAYHMYAALSSNGVWFITQMTMLSMIWEPIENGDVATLAMAGVVYVISTSLGSVFMMKVLLGHLNIPVLSRLLVEKDKREVGAR
jgi:hypothetical protein